MDDEDYKAEEEIKRKTTVKMQLPFWYGPDNAKALNSKNTLPNNYFESHVVKEPEEKGDSKKVETVKPVFEGKRYFPPMVLEQKLMDLENKFQSTIQEVRNDEKLVFEIEKEVLLTVFSESLKGMKVKLDEMSEEKALKERPSSDSDVSSCKAFIGDSLLRDWTTDDQEDFEPWDLEDQFDNERPIYFPTEEDKIFQTEFNDFLFPKSDDNDSPSYDTDSDTDINLESKNVGEDKGKGVCEVPVQFDFCAQLPDHSDFLINEEKPEKIFLEGESSKSAKEVSVHDGNSKSKSNPSLKKKKRKTKRKKRVNSFQTQYSKAYNSYLSGFSDRNLNNNTRLEWRIKASTQDVAQIKSSHVNSNVLNSKKDNFVSNVINYDVGNRQKLVVPYKVYSMRQLINLARDQVCCASCGVDDFICKSDYNRWFYPNTYSKTSYRMQNVKPKPTNPKGPDWQWVPKTV